MIQNKGIQCDVDTRGRNGFYMLVPTNDQEAMVRRRLKIEPELMGWDHVNRTPAGIRGALNSLDTAHYESTSVSLRIE